MRQALLGIGVARGQECERFIELGVDAGGAEQRLLGLFVIRFQLGVLQIAARAGAVRVHGGLEVAAGFFVVAVPQRQQAETLLRLGDLDAVVQQPRYSVADCAPARRSARASRASATETALSGKSFSLNGRLEIEVV